jgi:hypothetical protein
MRVEPADLFAHVEAVRENRDLLRHALLVDGDARRELLHGEPQPIALLDETRRRARVDAFHGHLDHRQSGAEVRLEPSAFRGAHLVEGGDRAVDDDEELGRAPLSRAPLSRLFAGADDVGHAQHGTDVELVRETESVLQAAQLIDGLAESRLVDASAGDRAAIDARREGDMAAPDPLAQRFAHVAFPLRKLGGELDRWVEEPVVHRPNLDGHSRSGDVPVGRAEAGHAFDHWGRVNEFTKGGKRLR